MVKVQCKMEILMIAPSSTAVCAAQTDTPGTIHVHTHACIATPNHLLTRIIGGQSTVDNIHAFKAKPIFG